MLTQLRQHIWQSKANFIVMLCFALQWLQVRRRLMIVVGILTIAVPVVAIVVAYMVVEPNRAYILSSNDSAAVRSKHIHVGIVLGSGITKDGKPFRELQSRLDVAAAALKGGYVDTLILSGDNRTAGYNEPKAMRDYLVHQLGVDATKLQPDYAGRSTYESCERASKIFGLRQTIIFSANSHLPRAIYLCRQFDIEAYGIASQAEANNASRREAVARVKAIVNVYIDGERTILGTPILLQQ